MANKNLAVVLLAAILFPLVNSMNVVRGEDKQPDVEDEWHEVSFPVDVKGKWGFIDANGRIIIEPAYDSVTFFMDGLSAVSLNNKYGYIDATGKMVIAPRFGYGFAFHEGLAWVDNNDGPSGFIDKTGKLVFEAPGGTYCREFHDGLALAMPIPDTGGPQLVGAAPRQLVSEHKVGFIDKTGQYVIKPELDGAGDFHDGLASASINKKIGFIDKAGQWVIKPQYDSAWFFCEGRTVVEVHGKKTFIDKTGNKALAGEFDDAQTFREGLAAVQIGGRWGFIDMNGAIVIKPQYDQVMSFFNGMASIEMDKKYGCIDKTGKMIIPPTYHYIHFFLGELAGVNYEETNDGSGTGYVNHDGKIVWTPRPKPTDRTSEFAIPAAGNFDARAPLDAATIARRNELLLAADEKIRDGLNQLIKTYPDLAGAPPARWNPKGQLKISAGCFYGQITKTQRDSYDLSVQLATFEGEAGMLHLKPIAPIYPHLHLTGRIEYDASNPEARTALKKLIGDALAPLEQFERQLAGVPATKPGA